LGLLGKRELSSEDVRIMVDILKQPGKTWGGKVENRILKRKIGDPEVNFSDVGQKRFC
jgi:hypothetical protein